MIIWVTGEPEKLPKPLTWKLLPTGATELPDSTPPPATR